MPSFLGGKSRGAFGQPAFFLAGNRMTIVAFEKEVSLKSLSLFSKRFFESCLQRTSSLCFLHGGELAFF